uniref:Feeding circuit activating peptide 2 n=1 Tax=Deroceras reticulatum TaxID=145610 RepID=A0A1X9WED1_DERRE|nr:feeding circuit activating peptide 2 [Deroceras reticulatum]
MALFAALFCLLLCFGAFDIIQVASANCGNEPTNDGNQPTNNGQVPENDKRALDSLGDCLVHGYKRDDDKR